MHILVTGAWKGYQECKEQINNAGHDLVFIQWEKDTLPVAPEWVEGVICNGLFLNHPIEGFMNLKYIQLTSAGHDRIPMEYVIEHGIEIHNAGGVYSIPMAEYAVGGVLQLYKQMPFFAENQKQHVWEKHRGLMELSGKTVLIIGCGSVGSECAKRFNAFGCTVIGAATYAREQEHFDEIVETGRIEEMLPTADIIIIAVPLNKETHHLFGPAEFAKMKSTAVIVNISRGAVIDECSLETALREKQIYGAVLDVFEEEPLQQESVLWDMENVIVTPHNSFVGEGNQGRLNQIILNNLMNYHAIDTDEC